MDREQPHTIVMTALQQLKKSNLQLSMPTCPVWALRPQSAQTGHVGH